MLLTAGKVLDGRYEILSLLGEGGLGTVYKATELSLGRVVAIKVLIHTQDDPEMRTRFAREAQSMAKLSHQNVVAFYRLGQVDSSLYIAMELVEGQNLKQVISEQGKLTWQDALEICEQVCQGLAAIHAIGLVHRDLKPNNILMTQAPAARVAKLADFGLAGFIDPQAESQRLTSTGDLIGSVYYMSPEQCMGKKCDARSDIYSLGCVLFECLAGEPPFTADNAVGLLHKHVNSELTIPAGIPSNVIAILQKCMKKDRNERYASTQLLSQDIQAVRAGQAPIEAKLERASRSIRLKAPGLPVLLTAITVLIGVIAWSWDDVLAKVACMATLISGQQENSLSTAQNLAKIGRSHAATLFSEEMMPELVAKNKVHTIVELFVFRINQALADSDMDTATKLAQTALPYFQKLATKQKLSPADEFLFCSILPPLGQARARSFNYAFDSFPNRKALSAATELEIRRTELQLAIRNDINPYIKVHRALSIAELAISTRQTKEALPMVHKSLEWKKHLLEKSNPIHAQLALGRIAMLAFYTGMYKECEEIANEAFERAREQNVAPSAKAKMALFLSYAKEKRYKEVEEILRTLSVDEFDTEMQAFSLTCQETKDFSLADQILPPCLNLNIPADKKLRILLFRELESRQNGHIDVALIRRIYDMQQTEPTLRDYKYKAAIMQTMRMGVRSIARTEENFKLLLEEEQKLLKDKNKQMYAEGLLLRSDRLARTGDLKAAMRDNCHSFNILKLEKGITSVDLTTLIVKRAHLAFQLKDYPQARQLASLAIKRLQATNTHNAWLLAMQKFIERVDIAEKGVTP